MPPPGEAGTGVRWWLCRKTRHEHQRSCEEVPVQAFGTVIRAARGTD